jgi:hypothetical protein
VLQFLILYPSLSAPARTAKDVNQPWDRDDRKLAGCEALEHSAVRSSYCYAHSPPAAKLRLCLSKHILFFPLACLRSYIRLCQSAVD